MFASETHVGRQQRERAVGGQCSCIRFRASSANRPTAFARNSAASRAIAASPGRSTRATRRSSAAIRSWSSRAVSDSTLTICVRPSTSRPGERRSRHRRRCHTSNTRFRQRSAPS